MQVLCTNEIAPTGTIELSSLVITEESAIGTAVGVLSVSGGSGSYTFSILIDPDNKFTIVSDELRIDQLLDFSTDSSHSVSVEADNGVDTPLSGVFAITVLENTAPVITALSPTNGAIDAVISTNLVLTFNKTVQAGTGNISVYNASGPVLIEAFNVATEGGSGAGQVEFSGNTVTLRMTTNFSVGVSVYVQIASTAIQNVSGVAFTGIADTTTWNFVTVSTPPIVANQTLEFGRLTRASAGRVAPVNTGTTITSAAINSGDASLHWQVNSSGEFSPTSAGDDALSASYTLGCTFSNAGGSDTATITITTEANVYSVVPTPGVAGSSAPETELDVALDHMEANGDGGKTVKMRPGTHRLPADQSCIGYTSTGSGTQRLWANQVTITSHDTANQVEFVPYAPMQRSLLRSWNKITLYRVKFHCINDGTLTPTTWNGFSITGVITNLIFEECDFYGDLAESTYEEQLLGETGSPGGIKQHEFLFLNELGASAINGTLHFKNCDFHGAMRLLSLPRTTTAFPDGEIIVEGCNFYDFSLDGITIIQSANLKIMFCDFYDPLTYSGNSGHGDCVQRTNTDQSDYGIWIIGCRALFKRTVPIADTKEAFQLLFLQTGAGTSAVQENSRIIGNLLFSGPTTLNTFGSPGAGKSVAQGIWSDHVGMSNSYIIANTIVCECTADAVSQPYLKLTGGGNNVITRNAMHSFTGTGSTGHYNNQETRSNTTGLSTTYDTLFTGIAGDYVPSTLAELETMFAPKSGSVLVTSGIGAHYVDRTNRIIDVPETNTAAWTAHADITGAVTNTLTTAAAGRQVTVTRDVSWATGSPSAVSVYGAAVNVSAASGTPQWKSSSDSGGSTPVTDWTTARGIIATGHYLWVRVTSSGSAATAVAVTLTVGANTDTWTVTTA